MKMVLRGPAPPGLHALPTDRADNPPGHPFAPTSLANTLFAGALRTIAIVQSVWVILTQANLLYIF